MAEEAISTTPTTDPMVPPGYSPTDPMIQPVPTLDEIERLQPGELRVSRRMGWVFYERLHGVLGERPGFRIACDGEDVEITSVSLLHEEDAWFGATPIEIV